MEPDTFKILPGSTLGMSTIAQGDESANASVKDIINTFSQVLFCVPDVERAWGFINDYPLSSLLEALLALREREREKVEGFTSIY